MAIKSVKSSEAAALIADGWIYVDVRTEAEFAEGHPPGAFNVPFAIDGPGGRLENPDFLPVMSGAFDEDARLLLGCRTGARSRRAAERLLAAGYAEVADFVAGWAGSRDAFGRPLQGWVAANLPIETGAPGEQSYANVKQRRR